MAHEEGCGVQTRRPWFEPVRMNCYSRQRPRPTPHTHHHTNSAHPRPRPHLAAGTYVEEVSCDVSVAAGEADRQEFSFTLYDFDGHGKVTKDDIAGLVRTIYDAVGSSLSLPPSGSRTIRVKLTVAPENGRGRQQDTQQQQQQTQQEEQEGSECRKIEEEIEGCHHSGSRSQRRRRARRRSTSLQRHELLQIIQANMEKNNLFYTPLHRRHDHHHHDHHYNRRRRRHGCACDPHGGSPPDPAEVKARLLEPDCPCRHNHYHNHSHSHNHTHGPPTSARSTGCRRHNRSHSHDLSRDSPHVFRYHLLDKTFQPLPPSNTPDQPPSPPALHMSNHHPHPHHHHHPRHYHHHHYRSRSFDGGDTQGSSPRGRSNRASRTHQQNQSQSIRQTKELQQTSPLTQSSPTKPEPEQGVGEVSPHHTKHRHREADHARAMAQVVAWLERGSLLESPRSPTSPECGSNCGAGDGKSGGGGVSGGSGGGGSGRACRDQNQHVHQHIHHHYHHYAEKQPPPLLI